MNLQTNNEIYDRLLRKPYLLVLETSLTQIPERVAEYDPNMFVCFNHLLGEFEVHSLRNKGDTHALSIPYPELDNRTLQLIAMRDQNRRSFKEIMREINLKNEKLVETKKRHRRSDINAIAREVRPVFKRFANEVM